MGYSCTAIASFAQDALLHMLQQAGPCPRDTSNGWLSKGKYYFFEIGREQHDGSITGAVWGPSKRGEGFVHRVGSLKVSADGKIERWPTSTTDQRRAAELEGERIYKERFVVDPSSFEAHAAACKTYRPEEIAEAAKGLSV